MSHILLTFLGRVPKDQQGYRLTRYDFGDDINEPPTAFFGWSLQRRLTPDRLVILGTAGSMWDHLFENDSAFNDAADVAIDLMGAVEEKRVTAAHLAPLAPILSARLGCEVCLELIPYARDSAEQIELLRIMANHVNAGDRVNLDVTHGFRHLPMLAILAALHLRSVRHADIGGIWYGAYDQDTGAAPVHNLIGLLHIADWLQALHTYDKDGDYGVFAPLLGSAGSLLAEAAFFERTTNPVKAREKLTTWVNREDRVPADDPAAALFSDALHERIRWYRGASRDQWESALAQEYLDRGDYVRAAVYGLESRISNQVMEEHGNTNAYESREQAERVLKSKNAFNTLKRVRNALAHGARPEIDDITQMVCNHKALTNTLRQLLRTLS
ncbi:TIGR02221 family CRISPR-associated protein [Chromatium okenii]|uniref:TIGR02221 family CRISPR-associated protein n=1 Tax=Chromatium okenii TaxID=61644 RepID=UPI0026F21A54|nr:TIGR02221 family CRISPR-associated protein [Chromatium okenii]MBV5310880.1 TIGR02221 family CRISPR-associated protein [Chromatium okenii]